MHTVLAINEFFRQIKSNFSKCLLIFTLQKCFFCEKLIVPNHSKHLAIHVYYPKFSEFSREIAFCRGKSRIQKPQVNIQTPLFSKIDHFCQKSKFGQTLASYSEPVLWHISTLMTVLRSLEYKVNEKMVFCSKIKLLQILNFWTFSFSGQNSVTLCIMKHNSFMMKI